jgi:CSLREA domain-containing protein
MHHWQKRFFLFLSFAFIFAAYPTLSGAETFCVEITTDDGGENPQNCNSSCDGGGNCSLRDAISAANVNANDPTVDEIIFSPSLPTGTAIPWAGSTDAPVVTESLAINGPGADLLAIDANLNDWALKFEPTNPATSLLISGLTLRDSSDVGAKILQNIDVDPTFGALTISNCLITGIGRGIRSRGNSLTISNSTISGNTSPDDGFGGGGLSFNGGAIVVENSTFSDNTAPRDTNAELGGGAISILDNIGDVDVTITNVTISGNETAQFGGGILIDGAQLSDGNALNANLTNLTIVNNTAESDGNEGSTGGGIGILLDAPDSLTLNNVLIADNLVGATGASPDCAIDIDSGTPSIVSNGSNLVRDDTGCTGLETTDITGEDPLLEALDVYPPGTTATYALSLSPPSPAINAAGSPCPPTDQRGVPRPQGSACDIGAFEAVICGDGTTGPGEDCEPDEECCTDACQFEAAGTACADGTCNASGQCVADGDGGGGCALSSGTNPFSMVGFSLVLLALVGQALLRRRAG